MIVPESHRPFLKAVCAAPDDDLPRLVYADFLEETGLEDDLMRAQFIRQQIRNEPASDPSQWNRSAPRTETLAGRRETWRRGFLHGISIQLDELAQPWLQSLLEITPLRELRLHGMNPAAAVSTPQTQGRIFDSIAELRIVSGFTSCFTRTGRGAADVFLQLLLRDFQNVEVFDFSMCRFQNETLMEFIAELDRLACYPQLHKLNLAHCHDVNDAFANFLATARTLNQLVTLVLTGVDLSSESIRMLRQRFGVGLRV